MLPSVLRQRLAGVDYVIKLSLVVAPDKAFVSSGINQLSFTRFLFSHDAPFDATPRVAMANAKVFANRITGLR